MALFEIPTGVLADTRGRRTSFLLSVVVVMLGTLGYVVVAGAGGGTIHVFGDTGKHEEQILVEDRFVTNVAFGGEDCRTLYATESHKGRLISFAWPVAGLKLFPDQRAEGRLSLQ